MVVFNFKVGPTQAHTNINTKFYFKSVIYGFQTTVVRGGQAKINLKVIVNLKV